MHAVQVTAEPGIRVSCVIVAYHKPDHVRRLLAALRDPCIETIVVNVEDDARIRELGCDRVVPTLANNGYAAGVNTGVAVSTSRVIVFMNDDVEAAAADVLRLEERISAGHADVAIPLVLNGDGRFELGNRLPLKLAQRMLLSGAPVPLIPLEVDAAWAPLVAVRADLARAIPLPEDYFMYWEEFDWFHRLRSAGARVEVNPSACVRHEGGVADRRPEKSRLLARNAVRCVRRIRGRAAALRAWPIVVLWQLQQLTSALLKFRSEPLLAHLAGVWAALAAWREI